MALFQYQALTKPVLGGPEAASVDRWLQPLSLPVMPRAFPVAALAAALSWSTFTPSVAAPATIGWMSALSTPQPVRQVQQSGATLAPPQPATLGWLRPFEIPRSQRQTPASGAVLPVSTSPETTTVDRWQQPLSLPVWSKSPRAWASFLAEPLSESPETSSLDRWFQPFSLPVWRKSGPTPSVVLSAPPAIIPDIGWFQGLAQPVPSSGLATAGQLAVAWTNFVPAPPTIVSLAAWFVNLSSPYPASLALGAAYQQAYFSYVSLEPGTVVPTVISGSVPGPSDGEDDRRRRWLEWSANRKRKAKPAPAIVPVPPPAVPAQPVAPKVRSSDVLARNVEAVRSQQDTAAAMQAILLAEQQAQAQKIEQNARATALRQQEDDDDDDAFSLFLDD